MRSFSIADVLDRSLRERPAAEALVDRYTRYTYRQLDEAARRAAAPLAGRGVGAGGPTGAAAIAYTSGPTGFPKGAIHSQHNLVLVGAVHAATGNYAPDTRFGVLLPLTILNLMVLAPLKAFQVGGCCITMDRLDPVGVAEWVRAERITAPGAVPTIIHGLLTHPGVDPDDLATLPH